MDEGFEANGRDRFMDTRGEGFQERAFAGAVWADDGRHARWRKISGHPLQRKVFAIADGKIADLDCPIAALTGPVEGAGIVAAIEMTGERGLRVITERRKQNGQLTPQRRGSGAPQADHIGKRPTPARAIRKIGHYKSG